MKRMLLSIVAGIVLSLIVTAATVAATDGPAFRRIGLYIGSNNGGPDRVTLSYATSDAETMAEVMNELGAVEKSDTILLPNPSSARVEESFERVARMVTSARNLTRRVEFLVYYSGHSDEEGLLLGGIRYTYARLRRNIEATGADVKIAILDSCSSGAFTRVKGGVMRQPFLVDESVNTSGYAFLTSSSADEASQESDRIGASFFTYYFVSALRGAADNTLDGKVTLNEAYSYASSETLARTANTQAGAQHPSYDIKLTGSGDLVLTDLRVTTAAMVLDKSLRGKFYVRDSGGRLVAEVRKYPGAAMILSLPAGRYTVDLEDGPTLATAAVTLANDYRPRLGEVDFAPMPRESTRSRGSTSSEELEHVNSYFSFLPTLPFMGNRRVVHGLSLSAVGDSYRVDGIDVGFASFVRDELRGTQITPIFGIVGGDLDGGQLSGVFNIVGGRVKGIQAAGVFNIDAGAARGFQLAGVFNINAGSFRGGQAGGVFNISRERLDGVQGAGVLNLAGGALRGVQAAGVVNLAGELRGAQIGVVNVGDRVHGIQIGVVNIAREMHGLPIGLISISKNGLHNPSTWADGVGYGYGGFQIGSGPLYTLVYAGLPLENPTGGSGAFGIGLGLHGTLNALWFDIDLSAKRQMNWNADGPAIVKQLGTVQTAFPSLRTAVGYSLFGRLGLFGGLTLEGHIPSVTTRGVFHTGSPLGITLSETGTTLELYPQWFLGIRL